MKRLGVIVLFLFFSISALAGGGDHYPNGAEDFLVGMLPPPGFYVVDYNYFYFSHSYKDDSGNTINEGPLDDFSLRVYANVLRFIYVTKFRLLGGSYALHVFVPWVEVNANCKGFHVHKKGLGDIIVDPFIVAWHFDKVHMVAGIDIYIPTGEYDKYRAVNIGKNFWTFEPVLAVTFLPFDKLFLSFKFMYDFNTTNNDWINPLTGKETSLKPGQEFHFDYALSYTVTKWLRVGLTGYYYQQTTDDEIDGKEVEHERGKAIAVGPGVKVDYGRFMFVLKTQYEFAVKNRPSGRNVWFKIYYTF